MQPANIVRIFQTHDSAGMPTPAEFVQTVHNVTASTLGWDAMGFLRQMNPTRTTDPLVFYYSDPARGSGWFRLEGFRPQDAQRIYELVQIEEISRVVGKDPTPKDDLTVGRGALLRSNNPWAFIVLGIVLALFPVFMWVRSPPGPENVPGYLVMVVIMLILGGVVLVYGTVRARWWHKARKYAKDTGQTLPPDLRGGM